MTLQTISDNIANVRERISSAAANCGRSEDDIVLMAVTKTRSAGEIEQALHAGIVHVGENYLQEALDKQAQLQHHPELVWHFIGPLQSNKTRAVAEHFDWAHSVDRLKIAHRLSEQRPPGRPPLNVCLQVNIDKESSKSGVSLEELATLAHAVSELPGLRLRGLMAIPAPSDDEGSQRRAFATLRVALDSLRREHLELDTLSMGMSGDLEAAVTEGATIVRVGTDIFGPRPTRVTHPA